jgi:hypothetical protein
MILAYFYPSCVRVGWGTEKQLVAHFGIFAVTLTLST